MSPFVWPWADKDCLSALPHCHYCITCVTFAALTIPTVPHCRVLVNADSSLQNCYGKTSWMRMRGKNWGIRHQFSFSKKGLNFFPFCLLLSPLRVCVFIWGCLRFAIWCHLKTPKLPQNNWSGTGRGWPCSEELSVGAQEQCFSVAFHHFQDPCLPLQLDMGARYFAVSVVAPHPIGCMW